MFPARMVKVSIEKGPYLPCQPCVIVKGYCNEQGLSVLDHKMFSCFSRKMFQYALCSGMLEQPEDLVRTQPVTTGGGIQSGTGGEEAENAPARPTEGKSVLFWHLTHCLNPFMLTAAKNSLAILMKSCRQKHFIQNYFMEKHQS